MRIIDKKQSIIEYLENNGFKVASVENKVEQKDKYVYKNEMRPIKSWTKDIEYADSICLGASVVEGNHKAKFIGIHTVDEKDKVIYYKPTPKQEEIVTTYTSNQTKGKMN